MQRKSLFTRALGALSMLSIVLLVSGCGSGPEPGGDSGGTLADMDPVVLRVSIPNPENGVTAAGMKAFADYAHEASDGKLDFEYYYNGTLIPVTELLPGVSSGIAEMGLVVTGYAPESLPSASWASEWTPSGIDWGFPKATISSAVETRFWIDNDAVREDMANQNIVPLMSVGAGPYMMLCTEPADTPEDLVGRTIRVAGEPHTTEVTNLGMEPSFIPGTETYEALQRGIIDCTYQDASAFATQGLMEVAKHFILTDGSAALGAGMAMNKDAWDALPAEGQEILRDATVPAQVALAQEMLDLNAEMIEQAKALGVTFHSSPAIDELLQKNRKAQGEAAKAASPADLEDPDAVVAEFQDVASEWSGLWDQHVGLDRSDSSNTESVVEALNMGSDGVDWETYETAIASLLEPVRSQ